MYNKVGGLILIQDFINIKPQLSRKYSIDVNKQNRV